MSNDEPKKPRRYAVIEPSTGRILVVADEDALGRHIADYLRQYPVGDFTQHWKKVLDNPH